MTGQPFVSPHDFQLERTTKTARTVMTRCSVCRLVDVKQTVGERAVCIGCKYPSPREIRKRLREEERA